MRRFESELTVEESTQNDRLQRLLSYTPKDWYYYCGDGACWLSPMSLALASRVLHETYGSRPDSWGGEAPPAPSYYGPGDELKLPERHLITQLGGLKIVEVDGEDARRLISDFTNFGQHYRFWQIPSDEAWLAKGFTAGELGFLIDHVYREWEVMRLGASYSKALELADRAERADRAKVSGIKPPKGGYPKFEDIIVRDLGERDGYKVLLISGRKGRDSFFVDFSMGGHNLVYSWVPRYPRTKGTIVLDDTMPPEARVKAMQHEMHEHALMAGGISYETAHRAATVAEHQYDTTCIVRTEIELASAMRAYDIPQRWDDELARAAGTAPPIGEPLPAPTCGEVFLYMQDLLLHTGALSLIQGVAPDGKSAGRIFLGATSGALSEYVKVLLKAVNKQLPPGLYVRPPPKNEPSTFVSVLPLYDLLLDHRCHMVPTVSTWSAVEEQLENAPQADDPEEVSKEEPGRPHAGEGSAGDGGKGKDKKKRVVGTPGSQNRQGLQLSSPTTGVGGGTGREEIIKARIISKADVTPADSPAYHFLRIVVLEPDVVDLTTKDADGSETGAVGDVYGTEDITVAMHNWAEGGKLTLLHAIDGGIELNKKDVCVVENFQMPVTGPLDGVVVKEGSWVQGYRVRNDELWKVVLDEQIQSVSVGMTCKARIEEVDAGAITRVVQTAHGAT